MAVGKFAIGQLDFVVNPFVVVFIHFHTQERQRERDGAGMEKFKFTKLPGFTRDPREQRRDGREREDERIEGAEPDVQPTVRPITGCGPDAQQNIGGKKSAEEHDFGC